MCLLTTTYVFEEYIVSPLSHRKSFSLTLQKKDNNDHKQVDPVNSPDIALLPDNNLNHHACFYCYKLLVGGGRACFTWVMIQKSVERSSIEPKLVERATSFLHPTWAGLALRHAHPRAICHWEGRMEQLAIVAPRRTRHGHWVHRGNITTRTYYHAMLCYM